MKLRLRLENSDSIKNAIIHYIYVAEFDSTSEIGKFSSAKLDSIWEIEREAFQSQLIYKEIENAYFFAERSKDAKLFLSLRDDGLIPNCVCGCPEKRFEKN